MDHSTLNPFEQIFANQSIFYTHPKSTTMLEDFACKCILKNYGMKETVAALGDLYRQCEEVAQANYDRMKLALSN